MIRLTHVLCLFNALVLSACPHAGLPQAAEPLNEPARPESVQVEESAELHISRHVRNTPGVVHVALWINAGLRDAASSDVAVLAALAANETVASELEVRIIPDGTSFSRTCARAEADRCVADLLSLLRRPSFDDAMLTRAHQRLQRWRQAALSDAAVLDRHAISGLLGDGSYWPQAPATAEGEANVARPSRAAITSFIADHYGPSRAALFLLGDLPDDSISPSFIARQLTDAITARQPRGVRTPPEADNLLSFHPSDTTRISILTTAPTRESALRATAMLRRRLPAPGLLAHTFAIRGQALIHIAGEVTEPDLIQSITSTLGTVRREMVLLRDRPPGPLGPPNHPAALARWLGERWATDPVDDSRTRRADPRYSVAISIPQGDGRRAQRRYRAKVQRFRRALEQSEIFQARAAPPPFTGEEQRSEFRGVNPQGVQISLQRRTQSAATAAAIAFVGGPAEDPASLHGRAALGAYALASECERWIPESLTVEPIISSERYGVLLWGPSDERDEILGWAIRCGVHFQPSSASIERGRARLRTAQREMTSRYQAYAARVLSPAQPGLVAPLGTPSTIADLRSDRLLLWLAESRVLSRTIGSAVGDLRLNRAREMFQYGVQSIPSGSAYRPQAPWLLGPPLQREVREPDMLGGALVWRLPGLSGAASAREMRASARLAADALQRLTGRELSWVGSGVSSYGGWFGAAIRGEESDLLPLQAQFDQLTFEVSESRLDAERESEASALSDPREAARARLRDASPLRAVDRPDSRSSPRMILFTR